MKINVSTVKFRAIIICRFYIIVSFIVFFLPSVYSAVFIVVQQQKRCQLRTGHRQRFCGACYERLVRARRRVELSVLLVGVTGVSDGFADFTGFRVSAVAAFVQCSFCIQILDDLSFIIVAICRKCYCSSALYIRNKLRLNID